MIEAQAARKKEEYLNNSEPAQIFKLYRSENVIQILVNNISLFLFHYELYHVMWPLENIKYDLHINYYIFKRDN